MTIHLAWIRATAAASIAAVGLGGFEAAGQYVPYPGVPQYSNVAPYGTQPQQQPTVQQQPIQQQAYQPAQQSPYPVTQPGTQHQQYLPGAGSQPPQYQQPQAAAPRYPEIAARPSYSSTRSPSSTQSSTSSTSLPASSNTAATTTPATSGGSMMPSSTSMSGSMMSAATTGAPADYGTSFTGYTFGDEGPATTAPSPYPTTKASYVNAEATDANTYSNCDADYGVAGYFDSASCGRQWFGGIYYLFMSRDNPDYRRFTIEADPGAYPYYPIADVTVLSAPHADHDYRSGAEIRFGSTLLNYSSCDTGCDPYGYGCNSCCAPEYAWEVGYWMIDDDINSVQVFDAVPTDTSRLYGMKNFAGTQYNAGGGNRPVNDFYGYEVPVTDPNAIGANDVRVLAQRVRSNFSAQNLELNLIRLPLCGGVSTCGVGSCYGGCVPACGSPFSLTTLCGFRYLRIDDDIEYATMFGYDEDGTGSGPLDPGSETVYTPWDGLGNELYYDVNVDNHLTGFQLGANMNYAVSCKCNVFWNTDFGLYNNHMESRQRIYGEFGNATWIQSGADVTTSSDKDDVAFVGEMRIGATYDFSCHWRGLLAYRAVAVSGVALSVDQMDEAMPNPQELALIDSDGSLLIHGLQVGAECRY